MSSLNYAFAISAAKCVNLISTSLHLGAGGTWPGEVALRVEAKILSYLASQLDQIVLIAGTNGKTTTAKMMEHVLKRSKIKDQRSKVGVVHNASGANLLNGITSALIQTSDIFGKVKADIGVFEVDEASLPLALKEFTPSVIVLLNLFRDQLDRYGEVDIIADKWLRSLKSLKNDTTIIINADDPHLAYIGNQIKPHVRYFGIGNRKYFLPIIPHAVDTIYCPQCGKRLKFDGHYLSHLGEWRCEACGLSHPKNDIQKRDIQSPLPGLYNVYNTMAATLTLKALGVGTHHDASLRNFQPAFGRQEEFEVDGKKIKIFLSKNPAGFNASLATVLGLMKVKAHHDGSLLIVLNDRIPDGRDVSWIWDVDFEIIAEQRQPIKTFVSGDRVYDLALRLKYAGIKMTTALIYADLKEAIKKGLSNIENGETLYILPTYSAMLEARKILRGRKIL